jgi:hypothetical protein
MRYTWRSENHFVRHGSSLEINELLEDARKALCELGDPHFINDSRCSEKKFFRKNGFCLFKSAFFRQENHQETISNIKRRLAKLDVNFVFNKRQTSTNLTEKNAQRIQFITKEFRDTNRRDMFSAEAKNLMQGVHEKALQLASSFFPNGSTQFGSKETILLSKINSDQIQVRHTDLGEEYVGKAILAFGIIDSNTTLIIYPGSHEMGNSNKDKYRPVRFGFDVGDIVLFHPLLIQASDKYHYSNIRLHYYLLNQTESDIEDITYPVGRYELQFMQYHKESMRTVETLDRSRAEKLKRDRARQEGKSKRMCLWNKRRGQQSV